MGQRKKRFKRFLSIVLSAALTVTGGAFGAFQTNNSTVAKAAGTDGIVVPNAGWTLYADDIAVDSAGVKYQWKKNNRNEVKVVGVTSSFTGTEYTVPASIPVTYAMYENLYLNSGSASAGTTKVAEIADEAFANALSLKKITISEGITTIGQWAFINPDLTQLEIPKSVVSIGFSTKTATDLTQYEILNSRANCKIYCWKDSYADKYFQKEASQYPDVTIEYLSDTEPDTQPTASPSVIPSASPVVSPSAIPSASPAVSPSAIPSASPAVSPSVTPSLAPTIPPMASPSVIPSASPTVVPSAAPSVQPTASASVTPSVRPTAGTSAQPGGRPSGYPIAVPGVTSTPAPEPSASASPASTAKPTASAVPEPTYKPSATAVPDSTETPAAVVPPTETPDGQNPVPDDNISSVSYQIDQNKNSVTVEDMRTAKISNVKIPSSVTLDGKEYPVTKIGKNAFAGNKNVKTVTLGKNVKTIGTGAFKGCSSLTSVKFPSKLTSIGKNSFYNCKKLKTASLPASTKKIGTAAFKNCKAMKQFVVGKKLKLKKGAWSAGGQEICYGAGSVKLDISASAFENCVSLRQMVINSLVRRIGNSALKNCKSLRSLIVNSEILKEVAKRALKGVHNCKISVPSIKLKPYSVLFKNKGQGKKVIVAKI